MLTLDFWRWGTGPSDPQQTPQQQAESRVQFSPVQQSGFDWILTAVSSPVFEDWVGRVPCSGSIPAAARGGFAPGPQAEVPLFSVPRLFPRPARRAAASAVAWERGVSWVQGPWSRQQEHPGPARMTAHLVSRGRRCSRHLPWWQVTLCRGPSGTGPSSAVSQEQGDRPLPVRHHEVSPGAGKCQEWPPTAPPPKLGRPACSCPGSR